MRIHFIIHEHFEAPGAYEIWATRRGFHIGYSRVYEGEPLPSNVDAIDLLIVMGGPQNPATTQAQCAHFDAKAEQACILSAIRAGKAVIGVCLGAQLIGEALGARYAPSPEREIGKFPITLTPAGLHHPLMAHFGATLPVGHWHNDMPGLTPDAHVLAFSAGCPRQIVAYSDVVFGFQCHMELTKEVVALLIEHDAVEVSDHHPFVESPQRLMQHDYEDMNQTLYQFLDQLVAYYQARC